jgi:hypothetical protein
MVVSLMLVTAQVDVNTEYLARYSYIDMTRFFQKSNGKAYLTSAPYQNLSGHSV